MSALIEDQSQKPSTRRLGEIPVRNLWLLMLYASDLYRYLGASKVGVEDNPEDIADLVAEILCHQVKERMMRNLNYGYESRTAVINRVRGRIDILTTERQRLLEKGKICCRFDDLTADTPRNRYVRSALEYLTKLNIKKENAYKCRNMIRGLERLGVSKSKPINYSGRFERFGRHDVMDQKMVAAADLVFSLAIPTEFDGQFNLITPDTQKEWLRKLFEKAIAGFYDVNLAISEWKVFPGERLKWPVSEKSAGIDKILPTMKTDITIDNYLSNERLIIDTKFNSVTKKGQYREETLRSDYIYQIYAYLRSQENTEDDKSLASTGMLLHPSIDKEVTEMATIQGHAIWFCTVDLGGSALSIKARLLLLIRKTFQEQLNGRNESVRNT